MKDLRTRRSDETAVDLDGPPTWTKGGAWDEDRSLQHPTLDLDHGSSTARPR